MRALFWMSSALIFYTYVLYPGAIIALARMRSRTARRRPFVTPVAVIIPALNEGGCIARKVRNVLASDYPAHLLRVIVVSDGSTDDTVAQARSVVDPRVHVIELPERSGKIAAINRAVTQTQEPILVLTDAAEIFANDAIRFLVESFADPRVGAVSGELRFVDLENGCSRNLGLYWRYEISIRTAESELSSVVGVTGAIYAIRRDCYQAVPVDTILDDVAIPLEVVLQGKRVRLESRACAYESATQDIVQEFARKRRTLAGNFQVFFRYWLRLLRANRVVAFQFFSHKVCRLLVPYALITLLAASFALPAPWRSILLSAQLVFYGLAVAAFRLRGHARSALFTLPYTFCALNWAAMMSLYDYFSGRQTVRWEKIK